MAYGYGSTTSSTQSSISDGLSLNPLPYPVLLILGVISVFLGFSWYSSFEESVEDAESQFNWVLFATPVALIILVRWLSSMENQDWSFFGFSPNRRRTSGYSVSNSEGGGGGGASPWGVGALIILLLVLVQYQSSFLDSWRT